MMTIKEKKSVSAAKTEKFLHVKGGGRPRKFNGASRPVTVTLPETTLTKLTLMDRDRALAIAKATDIATSRVAKYANTAEVVEIEKGSGIILVGPNKSLKNIPWLRMVEVSPGRYLLSIPSGMSVDSLEITLLDLIDHLPPHENDELAMLTQLRDLIRHLRRGKSVSKMEILIVKTRP